MSARTLPLAVVATFRARPGKEDELGRQLLSLVTPTRAEEGSLFYHICQAEQDGREWVVLENWRDRSAFDSHMATSYVRGFMAQVPRLCDADPTIHFHQIRSALYGAAEETVQAETAGRSVTP